MANLRVAYGLGGPSSRAGQLVRALQKESPEFAELWERHEVAKRFEDAGVAAIVYTDIARDGMLAGPYLDASAELADAVTIPVIISGGLSSEDDLVAAARLAPRGIAGAIAGRALYTGAVDLASALRRLASL